VTCLVIYARKPSSSRSPVGSALICFGLFFALWVTIGRTYLGLWAASQSRYETQNLLILAGCYLCLLDRWPALHEGPVKALLNPDAVQSVDRFSRTLQEQWRQVLLVGLRAVALILIVVEVEGGIANGIPSGFASRQAAELDNLVAAHVPGVPNSLIKSEVYPNGGYANANIPGLVEAAKKHHLSFFATSDASRLAHTSLPKFKYIPAKTSIGRPADGAVLHGPTFLVARASSDYPIASVTFQIDQSGGQQVQLIHAYQFPYGYLGIWTTTKVPNGTYTVRSTLKDIAGHSTTSRAIAVTVQN
jgi:Bacterial Ig domain